jgi:hypothetical protein
MLPSSRVCAKVVSLGREESKYLIFTKGLASIKTFQNSGKAPRGVRYMLSSMMASLQMLMGSAATHSSGKDQSELLAHAINNIIIGYPSKVCIAAA